MMGSALFLCVVIAVPPASGDRPRTSVADRLVREALVAELKGDNATRSRLLEEALRSSRQCESAHWQSGHVRVGREWLTISEAEQAAAKDKTLKLYRERLAESYERLPPEQVHLAMAQWCRQNSLPEHERFHWLRLLAAVPGHPEAIAALGLRPYDGEWLTSDEVKRREELRRAAHQWRQRLEELVKRFGRSGDSNASEADWERLRSIDDPAAVPALVNIVATRGSPLGLEVVALLGRMRHSDAANGLVMLTDSTFPEVQKAALAQLKERPLGQSVPWLLARMGWPLELEQALVVSANASLISYTSRIAGEGPDAKFVLEVTGGTTFQMGVKYVTRGAGRNRTQTITGPSPAQHLLKRERALQTHIAEAQRTKADVAACNRRTEERNQAASRLLTEVTGQDLGVSPDAWLNWWTRYNELKRYGEKPVYTWQQDQSRIVRDCLTITTVYASCFTRGTPIWAQTGLTPIERLQPGDLVLAQDPDSGQLAYKAVLAATQRPPSRLVRLRVEDEEITATAGHPFWVAGHGWEMAKQLRTDQRLHGLQGSWPLRGTDTVPDAEAYNLVVDGFHTYFVGSHGLLVHDNSIRRPTTAVLPGLHQARE
jgi:DNA-directed RNA polymerase subunit L